jgi:hypothetical protein
MKKKIIAMVTVGSLLFGGTAGAVSTYYLNEVNNYKEAKKVSITEEFDKENQHLEEQLYHDTVSILNREYERMDKETAAYLNQKFNEKTNNVLNENDAAITAETDKAIAELKAHIDSLFQ